MEYYYAQFFSNFNFGTNWLYYTSIDILAVLLLAENQETMQLRTDDV